MAYFQALPTMSQPLHLAISKLPPFSPVAVQLLRLVVQDEVAFNQVTDLLSTDAAFSVEVLRVANSSLISSASNIDTIFGALVLIGMNRLASLITTTALWRCVPGSLNREIIGRWWRHNLATALLAQRFSPADQPGDIVYTAGLLHSAGQLALLGAYPTEYATLLAKPGLTTERLCEMERRRFQANHFEVGEALLTAWRLPSSLVAGARCHHPDDGASITESVHWGCLGASRLGFAMVEGDCDMELPAPIDALLNTPLFCTDVMQRIYEMEKCLA